MKRRVVASLTACTLAACTPFVEVIDVSKVPPADMQAAQRIRIITIDNAAPPDVAEYLGPIDAFSCKAVMTDPPATRGNALQQLRYKALKLGADAIIEVTFDTRGTDTWGTNCWETVTASGSAVKLKK